MAKIFYANYNGIRNEVLKAPGTVALVSNVTQRIARTARSISGEQFEGSVAVRADRAKGLVRPGTDRAYFKGVLRSNALLKAKNAVKI
ncbi:MAG: hypothetical protein FWF33_00495 [Clostridiales bacterium]|nr:hypothetical protein [Clostridiales bacterium]